MDIWVVYEKFVLMNTQNNLTRQIIYSVTKIKFNVNQFVVLSVQFQYKQFY